MSFKLPGLIEKRVVINPADISSSDDEGTSYALKSGKEKQKALREKERLRNLRAQGRSISPRSHMPVQGERVQVGGLYGADCIYNGQNGIIVDWSNDRGTVRIETGSRVGGQVGKIVDVQDKNVYPCCPTVYYMQSHLLPSPDIEPPAKKQRLASSAADGGSNVAAAAAGFCALAGVIDRANSLWQRGAKDDSRAGALDATSP